MAYVLLFQPIFGKLKHYKGLSLNQLGRLVILDSKAARRRGMCLRALNDWPLGICTRKQLEGDIGGG